MAITYVASASAQSSSVSLPAGWQAGDFAMVLAHHSNGASIPSAPAGWTLVNNIGLAGGAAAIGYRILQTGDTTTGNWQGERIGVTIYRGVETRAPLLDGSQSTIGVSATTACVVSTPSGATYTSDSIVAYQAISQATTNNLDSIASTGWTNRTSGGNSYFGALDSPYGTSGSTWTQTATSSSGHGSIALRAASAYPQVVDQDTQTGTVTSNSSSWTLTYPTHLQSGDLILALVAADGGGVVSSVTGFNRWVVDGSAASLSVLGRVSDGTETGTFSATLAATEQGAWRVLRIIGWYGSGLPSDDAQLVSASHDAGLSAIATFATSATPDAPPLDPSNWGSEPTLWISAMAADTSRTVSAYPSNLTTDNGYLASGGSGGATLGWARTESALTSLNPNAFTISSSDDWAAATIAIRPYTPPSDVEFRASNAGTATGATSITATRPTTNTGDAEVAVVVCNVASGTPSNFTGPTGWTLVGRGATINSTNLKIEVWWHRYTSGDAAPVWSGSSGSWAYTLSSWYSSTGGKVAEIAETTLVTGFNETANGSQDYGFTNRTTNAGERILGVVGYYSTLSNGIAAMGDGWTVRASTANGSLIGSGQVDRVVLETTSINGSFNDVVDRAKSSAWFTLRSVVSSSGTQYSQSFSTPALSFTGATPFRETRRALTASVSPSASWSRTASLSRALTAALGFTGSAVKQARRSLAGSISPAGAIASSKTFLRSLTASLSFTSAQTRRAGKALAATLGPSATIVKQERRSLSASVGFTGATAKQGAKSHSGSLSFSGSTTKRAGKVLAGALSPAATVVKETRRSLSGVLDFAGAILSEFQGGSQQYTKDLTAALGFVTGLGRTTTRTVASSAAELAFSAAVSTSSLVTKALSATLGFAASVAKQARHPMTGSVGFSGQQSRQVARNLSASLSPSASLNSLKTFVRAFTATLSPSAQSLRTVGKSISASISPSSATSREVRRTLGATLGFTSSAARRTSRALVASLSPTGSLGTARTVLRAFTAVIDFTVDTARQTRRSVAASLSTTSNMNRSTSRALAGSLDFAGSVSSLKAFFRDLSATLGFSTAWARTGQFGRNFAADLTLSSALSRTATRVLEASAAGLSFVGNIASQFQGGAQEFFKTLTASLSFTGDVSKSTSRSLSASLGLAGSVAKMTGRALSGGLGMTGAMSTAKVLLRAFSATLSMAAGVSREARKTVSAAVSFQSAMSRRVSRPIAATLDFTSSATRRVSRTLTAGLSFAGGVASAVTRLYLQALSATLSFSAGVSRSTSRSLAASLSLAGEAGRITSKAVSASLTLTGQITRTTARSLTGLLVPSGGLSRSTSRALEAALSFTGAIVDLLISADTRALKAIGRAVQILQSRSSVTWNPKATASAIDALGRVASTLRSRGKAGKQ